MDAVRANVDLAGAVLKQAENQKNAGSGTRIEATRAKVQLSDLRAQTGRRNPRRG